MTFSEFAFKKANDYSAFLKAKGHIQN